MITLLKAGKVIYDPRQTMALKLTTPASTLDWCPFELLKIKRERVAKFNESTQRKTSNEPLSYEKNQSPTLESGLSKNEGVVENSRLAPFHSIRGGRLARMITDQALTNPISRIADGWDIRLSIEPQLLTSQLVSAKNV
ncbi:predicted protein [Botrytis cinerea T4]|uniref:Uncharacterized protein n=1 Tax=Botryotinia fuckeliana (strain T4) TaxID=999810 RepID=G2YKW2_BOTF4|nr:predicted protein [Botrytis cinerea T4]